MTVRLRGRDPERAALDGLLDEARRGHSKVLVLRGEAGVGKTALLDYLQEQASGFRSLRVVSVESEMELAFSGLHQLCSPILSGLDTLPIPQRDALNTAFGFSVGEAPDRFIVSLAVLGLLSGVAEERPLVCLIDDAQWLDRASAGALAFVARRLLADPVVMVFSVREPNDEQELAGFPALSVRGLGDRDSRALLQSVVPGRLDERVQDRIVAETHGNPLALLELPRGMSPAQLAGGFGLSDPISLAGRIELSFLRRVRELPAETQRLLLTAALEPFGDATLLWRAAERLGIGAAAVTPAEESGLVEFRTRVIFRHPLVRSAACRAASLQDHQECHRALGEGLDDEADRDRRAWHRAHAAAGPDESIAAELELSATRVMARGGVAAAAAFLERATALSPDPARRVGRALAAAEAKLAAASPEAAAALLSAAAIGPLDELQRARLERLRAQVRFAENRGRDAPPLLLAAAQRLEPLDADLARKAYLDAMGAALFAGRLGKGGGPRAVADAARAAPPASQPGRPADLLLDGLATRITAGYPQAVQPLRASLEAFNRHEVGDGEDLQWLWITGRIAPELWEDQSWHALTERAVRLARDAGDLAALPIALHSLLQAQVCAGEFDVAEALLDEAAEISAATGGPPLHTALIALNAWRGNEKRALEAVDAGVRDAMARGEGRVVAFAEYFTAVLYNGLARYEDALAAAERATAVDDFGSYGSALAELIEGAARSGASELAREGLDRLRERTGASGTDWALGTEAGSVALVSEGRDAEDAYLESIEHLGRTRVAVHLARAHLLYGEWLRREQRNVDARTHLNTARDMFLRFGADGFAERASRELRATGATVRSRTVTTRDILTPQELQVAKLAADGHTNPEIGARLFISPRTAEYHLHKVYTKLDIDSRRQLRTRIDQLERGAGTTR